MPSDLRDSAMGMPEAGRGLPWWPPERWTLALPAILAAGLSLRLIGLSWGLPEDLHPDEGVILAHVEQMSWSHPNPGFFNYPGLFLYQVFVLYRLVTRFGGAYEHVVLAARLLTAFYGWGCILVVYALGARLAGRRAGVIAAGLLAVTGAATLHAHYAVTDIPMTTLATASVWLSVRARQRRSRRDLLVAAAVAGLAVSTKYSAAPVCIVPWLAFMALEATDRTPWGRRLIGTLGLAGAALAAFLITSPYTLLDYPAFARDIGIESRLQAEGRAGEHVVPLVSPTLAQRGLIANGRALLHDLGPMALGLATGCLIGVWWRRPAARAHPPPEPTPPEVPEGLVTWDRFGWIMVFTWVLLYYALMAPSAIGGQRYVLPLLPALVLMAAGGYELSVSRLGHRLPPLAYRALVVSTLLAATLPPARMAIDSSRLLARRDTRLVARDWIVANIPAGAHLAREHYAPVLHTSDGYPLSQPFSLTEHPLATYCDQGVQYLLLSSLNRDRYFEDESERFAAERAWYQELERRTRVVERFPGTGDLELHQPTIEVRRLFCPQLQ